MVPIFPRDWHQGCRLGSANGTLAKPGAATALESGRLKKLLPLDGSPVPVKDQTVASAALDAGWLAITIRTIAPMDRGAMNVRRDVYIAERRQIPFERVVNYDELTIWRNFTVEWPDGSVSSSVCSYREALVYQRQRQP